MLDTPISALGGWPTVSARLLYVGKGGKIASKKHTEIHYKNLYTVVVKI
jgi:hypothetical protein